MDKRIKNFGQLVFAKATKFTQVSVPRGKTVLPLTQKELEKYGLRADYDGIFTTPDGTRYNKFNVQPNAGKVPNTIKQYLSKKKKGTHSILGSFYVRENGTAEDVEEAVEVFRNAFKAEEITPVPTGNKENLPLNPKTPSRESSPGGKGKAPATGYPSSRESTPEKGKHPSGKTTPSRESSLVGKRKTPATTYPSSRESTPEKEKRPSRKTTPSHGSTSDPAIGSSRGLTPPRRR